MTTNNKTTHIQDNGLSYRPEKETQKVKSFIIVIKDNLILLFVFIEVFIKKIKKKEISVFEKLI